MNNDNKISKGIGSDSSINRPITLRDRKTRSMTYSSVAIANYFIKLARRSRTELTTLKLIKLVYIAHGWHLAILNYPLLKERIFAYRYGPVIEPLYHELIRFGIDQIKRGVKCDEKILRKDKITRALLDKVWKEYGKLSGIQLSNVTHKEDSPWQKVWLEEKGCEQYGSCVIGDEYIKDYYKKLADSA